MAQSPSGDYFAGNPYVDQDGDVHANNSTIYLEGSDIVTSSTDGATIKGIHSTTISVTVPTIADAECDLVAVDVSGMTFQCVVGDLVFAQPIVALPTDCLYGGSFVSATDEVTISFMTKEGGSGVTGAAKNFKFLFFDMT